ncbi:MAG: succinate dehydrogenase cytochrome b subunit [Balneolaceae bacterium]
MPTFLQAVNSQVGRKFLTGVTGIAIIIFIIFHLIGNLTIFSSDPQAFNAYTYALESMGILLYIAEAGLLLVFIIHAYIGLNIWWNRRKVRPQKYEVYSSKGEPSKQGLSSRSMAFTGAVLLVFLVFHLVTFKFGMTESTTLAGGQEARDLRALVIETFQKPIYAFGYTFVMILLGAHLGHGVWSAFTSLTMSGRKLSSVIYTSGVVIAVLLAVGFLFIPLYIYFGGGCEAALVHCQ